jgi:hypothetical protein
MALDFSKLKASSGSKSFEALNAEIAKFTQKVERGPDERFWTPTVDKAGNGYAIIRFLPALDETIPFVRIYDHGFQGPTGKWYIENSLTTFEGEKDPVSDYNSQLWNSGVEKDKDVARKQKRRLHFFSNILVIDDPVKPECNGKVYLFKYGKKIFNKLSEATTPQFADEVAFNAFDMFEGAPFKIKIRNIEGYRNYDKSEFGKVGPISKDEDEIKAIWEKTFSLQELLDRKHFKSFADLAAKMNSVLNPTGVQKTLAEEADIPWVVEKTTEKPKENKKVAAPVVPSVAEDDDEEGLAYFQKLAQ